MNNGFVSIYTSYDKLNIDRILSILNSLNIEMKIKTSTDITSKDTIYEILVLEQFKDQVHNIIIENQIL